MQTPFTVNKSVAGDVLPSLFHCSAASFEYTAPQLFEEIGRFSLAGYQHVPDDLSGDGRNPVLRWRPCAAAFPPNPFRRARNVS